MKELWIEIRLIIAEQLLWLAFRTSSNEKEGSKIKSVIMYYFDARVKERQFDTARKGRRRTQQSKALLWLANYLHYDFGYITTKHNIVHFEKLTLEEIEKLYLEFHKEGKNERN